MKRILIYLSAFLFVIVVAAGAGAVLLYKYLDPNDFKPILAQELKKLIKRDVTISGGLSWTIFPEFGVKIGRLSIANPTPTSKGGHIDIAESSVSVRLLPILHKQIEISGIRVTGIDIPQYHIRNAELRTDNVKQNVAFPVTLTLDYLMGKTTVPVRMTSHLKFDSKTQTLDSPDIKVEVDGHTVTTGSITLSNLRAVPEIDGQLTVDINNLMPLLATVGTDTKTVQEVSKLTGNLALKGSLDSVSASGKFTLGSVRVNGLRITNIQVKPRFANGLLDLNPVTASFYQGDLNGRANVNLSSPQPVIAANLAINHLHTESLVKDLLKGSSKITIVTTGDVNLAITTSGLNADALTRNLNGNGQFNFGQGYLSGIDLKSVITSAYALIKREPNLASANTNQSRFNKVSGTMVIRNGIMQSNNMTLDSPEFSTQGAGRIDLPSNWINCVFETKVKQSPTVHDDWTNLYGIAIPIAVRGQLNDPSVSLDAGQFLKAIAAKQLGNTRGNIKKNIQDQIIKNVSPEAGALVKGLLQ